MQWRRPFNTDILYSRVQSDTLLFLKTQTTNQRKRGADA